MSAPSDNTTHANSNIRKYLGWLATLLALGIALTGIANSAPSFWGIPSIGPFRSEYIRPLIVFLAVTIVLIHNPVSDVLVAKFPRLKAKAWLVDVAIWLSLIHI